MGGLNFVGEVVCAYERYRAGEDYSGKKMCVDMAKGVGASSKNIATVAASVAAVSAVVGFDGGAVVIPAAIAVSAAVCGVGRILFRAWLPRRYRLLVSRL